jgi:hypothetical protein
MRINQSNFVQPRIFVSSTSGDLMNELRSSICDFLIKELGFIPLMWEDGKHFPYVDTAPNKPANDSIRAVKQCHIYILIIGPTYGTRLTDSGPSITHEEYLNVLNANVPIYAFVPEKIFNVVKLFNENPDIDFNSYVVDNEVFKFINDLIQKKTLVWKFNNASDIIRVLRDRFALLFGALLNLNKHCGWLNCMESAEEIEKNAKEVWVATLDLYWDSEYKEFRDLVRENVIKRGVIYKYIIIDTKENRMRFDQMIKYYINKGCKDAVKQVTAKWVLHEQFKWITEVVIYNPNDEFTAILVNPMDVINRDEKYDIILGDKYARRLHEQLSSILN